MAEILQLIKEARRDPDVVLDFDDAIQVDPLCDGRYQRKPSRYELRYRPDDRDDGGWWELDLDHDEIEDIASGWMTVITLHCAARRRGAPRGPYARTAPPEAVHRLRASVAPCDARSNNFRRAA